MSDGLITPERFTNPRLIAWMTKVHGDSTNQARN